MTCRLKPLVVSCAFCFVAFLMIAIAALPAAAQAPQANNYIVSFQPGTPRAARAAAAGRHGASLRFNYDVVDAMAVTVPNENSRFALSQEAGVISVVPDYPVFASQSSDNASDNAKGGKPGGGSTTPPPPSQITPAGVARVGAPTATSTGLGIRVAIADTGIDTSHRDLRVVEGHNAFDGTSNCLDNNGHGTHVAGTVAALNNEFDVLGVAPEASLYCVKVLDAQGSGSWSVVIAGLDWIWNNGAPRADVVNMSLGGPGSNVDSPFKSAVGRLSEAGVIVVVSAGNDPNLDVSQQVPAAYTDLVLTVASTTATDGVAGCGITVRKDTASYFTSDGLGVTISAPGEEKEDITKRGANCYLQSVGILSLKLGGGTTRMSGTSMAAPHVSGIVARLLQDSSAPHTLLAIQGYFNSSAGADLIGTAPYDSRATSYTWDFDREGVAVIR